MRPFTEEELAELRASVPKPPPHIRPGLGWPDSTPGRLYQIERLRQTLWALLLARLGDIYP